MRCIDYINPLIMYLLRAKMTILLSYFLNIRGKVDFAKLARVLGLRVTSRARAGCCPTLCCKVPLL